MTTPIDTRDAQSSAPLTLRKSSFITSLGKVLAFVLLALLIAAVALIWLRLDRVESEGKLRGAELASRTTLLETQSKLMQDSARELNSRANAIEARITEAANSQAQLEKLYSNRSTDDTDSLLSDIEQSVSLANQQLLASGQIASALLLLQDADRGALKSKNPSLLLVHRLLLKDIEKLKAAPAVDVIQLSNRLDSVGASLDGLPLLTDMPKKADAQFGQADNASRWTGDLKRLFNIHKVDEPSALLLSPEQAFFVRQNAKLALASARLALFSRNETLFKADIQKVISALKNYFDGRNNRVGAQIANLEQLATTKIAVETPTLSETLNAIRSARNQR
jgi:uroporphyrin-III C-methyltransferase